MAPNGKCVFNNAWLEKEEYKEWILQGPDRYKAKCCVCMKNFDVSAMGESALKSHMKGLKHNSLLKAKRKTTSSITEFFVPPASSSLSCSNEENAPTSGSQIDSFASKKDVLDAEILWVLKCIQNHYSYKSCEGLGDLFRKMFTDSLIAKQFSCGESKAAYLCHFGLAPYFQMLLLQCLKDINHYTLLFDETLNASTQKKQMDIHVRFWHSDDNRVRTQYLTSIFLGHSTANDLLKAFYEATEKMDRQKLLQISMDGPAVNWKFYDILQKDLDKEFNIQCVSVGSCGLHILNNAFRKGVATTQWNIPAILNALYWLFKDSPARRDDFLKVSENKKFPLKFCNHRWLENCPATERALEIWDDVIRYIKETEKGIFLISQKISCKSFIIILEGTKDPLMVIKFNIFLSVAKILQPFLEKYQTDKPMLPFLGNDMLTVICNCVRLFKVIKPKALESLNTAAKLCTFDFNDANFHESKHKISLGFVGDKLLKEKNFFKKISEGDSLTIKNECKNFVLKLVQYLMEKCPITYQLVRNVSCWNPCYMVKYKENSKNKMKNILSYFSQKKLLSDEDGDKILLLYHEFLDEIVKKNLTVEFENFDNGTMSVDVFFYSYLKEKKYAKLLDFLKMILILSHGQASVERGFSVNRAIEVENLKDESYISQRLVYDYMKFCGGVINIQITKELRLSASSARLKYHEYLDKQKALKISERKGTKRKLLEEEIDYLEKKRCCMQNDINEYEKEADKFAQEGEIKKDISLFLKSNGLRKTIKEKCQTVNEINEQINAKKADLKNL